MKCSSDRQCEKQNCIRVLVMVASGAVCMYYLHLSDVVIEAQCCYESG